MLAYRLWIWIREIMIEGREGDQVSLHGNIY